ncbi:MAG: type I restriction endonuclease [Eubacteriaceae bacterium]
MDFDSSIKQFAKRVEDMKDKVQTEEATKTALIMPFFSLLGYDVFNPSEFVPEFTADFGTKKGEKVDYAIFINGEPIILIEAKSCSESILDKHGSQLFRYFSTTTSKFGILTNGIKYHFFTDLDETNKLDLKPFFEFDFLDLKDSKIKQLMKFKKENFDVDNLLDSASELKYMNDISLVLNNIFETPSDNFIEFILSEFYNGRKTQNVKDKFTTLITKAIKQYKSELLNTMLNQAINKNKDNESKNEIMELEEIAVEKSDEIKTTLEEIESFGIVKTLLSDTIDFSKITYKDTLSYLGILIDGNTRKWICRLVLKENSKSIIIADGSQRGQRYSLENIHSIIQYKNELIKAVGLYNIE